VSRTTALLAGLLIAFAIAAGVAQGSTRVDRVAQAGAKAQFHNCTPFASMPSAYQQCCAAEPTALGCPGAPRPTPRTAELVVTVLNSRRDEVRGVDIEVKNSSGRVLKRGTTAGPEGNLKLRGLRKGTYRVVGRTPRAQLPLNLQSATSVTTKASGTSRATLRMTASCTSEPETREDDFISSARLPATSFSHGGANDYASAKDDVIRGSRLADVIADPQGEDVVCGNDGADRIRMFGNGQATVFGGDGNDTITLLHPPQSPASYENFVDGGEGNDVILGGDSRDALFGDTGNDQIAGGQERDLLNGGAGNDRLSGGFDVDSLFGREGNDQLNPGPHARDASTTDPNSQQTADCGAGTDNLDRRDIWQPFVNDTSNPQPGEAESLATLRANPNFRPSSTGCETETPMPGS
jgi:hypothetical protein